MTDNTLKTSATLIDAIRAIEKSPKRLAVVISDDNKVLGTLTDGDIRRYILQGHKLEASVIKFMNSTPVTANINTSDSMIYKLIRKKNIRALPLVDNHGKYIRTLHEFELINNEDDLIKLRTFSTAVIMAGGEGKRLRPITKSLPKPMVQIRGLPLIENQIRRLNKMGIPNIYISVNYLSDVIKDYFGDGSELGVNINYLHEEKKLGTAGALSLLPNLDESRPVIVINGDVLTTSDFVHLFNFHEDYKSAITISAVEYNFKIPYGVIESEGVDVKFIKEKPSQSFLCNAGIYALSTKTIKKIPTNKFWNMTDLIQQCLSEGEKVTIFPVHEYWTDIGTSSDLEKARKEFKGN